MNSNEPPEGWVTICGGCYRDWTPRANVLLSFGRKEDLTEEQLKTIQWLRHFRARPIMKKNNVRLDLWQTTEERYNRILSILNSEKIPFTENQY